MPGGDTRHASEWAGAAGAGRRGRRRRPRGRRRARRGPPAGRRRPLRADPGRRPRARRGDPGRGRRRRGPPRRRARRRREPGGRPDTAGVPGARTCWRPTAPPTADGFTGTDTASCVERYAAAHHRGRAVGPGQPQDHLPRGPRARRAAASRRPGERLEHAHVVARRRPASPRPGPRRAAPGRRPAAPRPAAPARRPGRRAGRPPRPPGRPAPRRARRPGPAPRGRRSSPERVAGQRLEGVGDRAHSRHHHALVDAPGVRTRR